MAADPAPELQGAGAPRRGAPAGLLRAAARSRGLTPLGRAGRAAPLLAGGAAGGAGRPALARGLLRQPRERRPERRAALLPRAEPAEQDAERPRPRAPGAPRRRGGRRRRALRLRRLRRGPQALRHHARGLERHPHGEAPGGPGLRRPHLVQRGRGRGHRQGPRAGPRVHRRPDRAPRRDLQADLPRVHAQEPIGRAGAGGRDRVACNIRRHAVVDEETPRNPSKRRSGS
mmetsp:Transcript_9621/g.33071  ORF Transcript_9621/g.33071 Transcript_9621/m.33071 type:complete len:230 (-) Transcript_9621:8-697(-)